MIEAGVLDLAALKQALIHATGPGKKWTRRSLSLAAGKSQDLVRDIISGRSKKPELDSVMSLAALLEMDEGVFVKGQVAQPQRRKLKVTGIVAAGVWREHWELPADQQYEIEVGPAPAPDAESFAVHLEGFSMDRTIPPGSDLECVRVAFGAIVPVPGDLVIVQRQNHDLIETTCKRLAVDDAGQWILRSESTRPEFQEPIVLGRPSRSLYVDNEIMIIGIVVSAQQRHYRPR